MSAAVAPSAVATSEPDGWAVATFDLSLRTAVLQGAAVWQAVMILAVLTSADAASERLLLVAAHLLVAGLAIGVLRSRVALWVLVLSVSSVMVLDWSATDSVNGVLSFATAWGCNLSQTFPVAFARGWERLALSAVVGLGVPAGLWIVHPDWLASLVLPAVVTGWAIRRAAAMAFPRIEGFAARVDRELTAGWREVQRGVAARSATAEAAEQARALHDTAINTLAAIASGGPAIRDSELVRQLCARDVRTLESMLDGSQLVTGLDLDGLVAEAGLRARRSGLDDAQLERAAARLPDVQQRAMRGVIREVLRNVAKHAGTGDVDIRVARDADELEVIVTDRGKGFDGRSLPGRGLAESVLARGAAAGLTVDVRTAPGAGTEVLVATGGGDGSDRRGRLEDIGEDFGQIADDVRRRAAWLWTAAVVGVGLVIETVNRVEKLSAAYAMLVVVALAAVVGWTSVTRRGRLGTGAVAVLVASVPVAFVLGVAGVDFGRDEAILWQAIGVSPPLVILLVHGSERRPLIAGVIGLLVASAVVTIAVAADDPGRAALIPIGTAPPLGVTAGWLRFGRAVDEIGSRVASQQHAAAAARVDRAEREAVASAHIRWRQAGLQRCLELLRGLAAGSVDASVAVTQAACAEEEAYLRQVTLLEPDLVRTGEWFARALAMARDRHVRLVVRTGAADVEDSAAAAAVGALLLDVVGSADAGSDVVATLLPTSSALRFGIVGPRHTVADGAARWSAPAGWTVATTSHGPVSVVEVLQRDRSAREAVAPVT